MMGHRMMVWVGSRMVSTTWARVGIPVYHTSSDTVGKSPSAPPPFVAAETADLASPLSLWVVMEVEASSLLLFVLGIMDAPKRGPILRNSLIGDDVPPPLHTSNGTEMANGNAVVRLPLGRHGARPDGDGVVVLS